MGPELSIRDRIKFVLSQKNISIAEFAGGNDTLRIKVTRQLNGTSEVGLNVIELFLRKFPDISAEWLLRGEAQMLRSDGMAPKIYNSTVGIQNGTNRIQQTVTSPSDATLQAQIDGLIKMLAMKDETIRELKDDKRQLNTQLSMLLVKIKKQ